MEVNISQPQHGNETQQRMQADGEEGMLEEDEEQVKNGVTGAFLFFTLTFFTWEKSRRADDLTADATK